MVSLDAEIVDGSWHDTRTRAVLEEVVDAFILHHTRGLWRSLCATYGYNKAVNFL